MLYQRVSFSHCHAFDLSATVSCWIQFSVDLYGVYFTMITAAECKKKKKNCAFCFATHFLSQWFSALYLLSFHTKSPVCLLFLHPLCEQDVEDHDEEESEEAPPLPPPLTANNNAIDSEPAESDRTEVKAEVETEVVDGVKDEAYVVLKQEEVKDKLHVVLKQGADGPLSAGLVTMNSVTNLVDI